MAAVRAALGSDSVPLMVDANSGYTDEAHAGPIADMLARYHVYWFEEPCVWDDLQCARAVRENHEVPPATGPTGTCALPASGHAQSNSSPSP